MKISSLGFPEVLLIEPHVFSDKRGFLIESWQKQRYAEAGVDVDFVQENFCQSGRNVLRGLHYQVKPFAQGKLVHVVRGEIFDVAVDMRKNSATFGQWVGTRLSETNRNQLWIPPGFAHGLLTLSDKVDLIYKCTAFYTPSAARIVRWDDAQLGIDWPVDSDRALMISDGDKDGVLFADAEYYT